MNKKSVKQSVRRTRTPSRHVEGLDYLQQRRLHRLIESVASERSYE